MCKGSEEILSNLPFLTARLPLKLGILSVKRLVWSGVLIKDVNKWLPILLLGGWLRMKQECCAPLLLEHIWKGMN